jgi:Leucine-rich repeat (LRR) protein
MLNLSEVKKHLYKFTDRNSKYFFKKHWKSILLTVWLLVSVAFILMFTWSLSRLNSKIFAQQEWIVLTSGNIVELWCNTWATSCNLSNKWITAIEPDAFVNHTNLIILNLSNNQISSLAWVDFPNSLQRLELSNNQINSLAWVDFPNSLKRLYLSNNQINSLAWVNFPNSLQRLELSNNQISSLAWITFPNSLTTLSLYNNQISSLAW